MSFVDAPNVGAGSDGFGSAADPTIVRPSDLISRDVSKLRVSSGCLAMPISALVVNHHEWGEDEASAHIGTLSDVQAACIGVPGGEEEA